MSINEEDVFKALSDLNRDKAPRLDHFPLMYCQFKWSFVKDNMMGLFKEFYDQGKFEKGLNVMFMVLLKKEKKMDVNGLKDFRPISLVGGLYKLLAKMLANRLKGVVRKLVSEFQNVCVEGRQILNTTLYS